MKWVTNTQSYVFKSKLTASGIGIIKIAAWKINRQCIGQIGLVFKCWWVGNIGLASWWKQAVWDAGRQTLVLRNEAGEPLICQNWERVRRSEQWAIPEPCRACGWCSKGRWIQGGVLTMLGPEMCPQPHSFCPERSIPNKECLQGTSIHSRTWSRVLQIPPIFNYKSRWMS